jgi:hypothetical protein
MRMFRLSSVVTPAVLCTSVEDEPQKFNSFRAIALLLGSLSFLVLGIQGSVVGFDVSRCLEVIARPPICGPTLVPRHVRPTRGISSAMLQSVTYTLYGVGFTCWILNERLSPNFFRKMDLIVSDYITVAVDALHTVETKVSQEGGRLLICNRAFNLSLIHIPCANSWEMIPSYSFRWVVTESDSLIRKLLYRPPIK